MMDSPTSTRPALILGFAAFLAASWTWCIGMFLPVLLVRDLGFGGWLIFAVPNVFGAAAMGWLLRSATISRDLVAAHRPAGITFSLVTIAFHIFFTAWLIPRLLGVWGAWLTFLLAGFLLALTCSPTRRDLLIAALVLLLSTGALILGLAKGLPISIPLAAPHGQFADLLYIFPVCVFGFLFCPYLDLTFHRIRQYATPAAARVAFTLGFGGFFLLMIVFSLFYARLLAPITAGPETDSLFRTLAPLIGLHMAVQTAFTLAVHLRELTVFVQPANRSRWGPILGVTFIAPFLLAIYANTTPRLFNLNTGESIYRAFLGFYGLVFPAYVYLCMVPFHSNLQPPTRARLMVLSGVVFLASPFFWVGFVQQRYLFLLPGLAIVLLAKAGAPRRSV